ncbi:hypothetical protein C8F04DRAFT_1199676 [Mycena alexandri]|uniref:Uncharacterized protein n=1 Tax=Mycena alexandri TaxID=1745969 RepID=A0AAD6S0D6_9AGAR|nr:hypothetical protein C8F04DRAFT_1199676 [Mycena alexandri]
MEGKVRGFSCGTESKEEVILCGAVWGSVVITSCTMLAANEKTEGGRKYLLNQKLSGLKMKGTQNGNTLHNPGAGAVVAAETLEDDLLVPKLSSRGLGTYEDHGFRLFGCVLDKRKATYPRIRTKG